jgi:hypothetical protein
VRHGTEEAVPASEPVAAVEGAAMVGAVDVTGRPIVVDGLGIGTGA